MRVIDRLLEHNARYAAGFRQGHLPLPPRLPLAVVACMDARLQVHRVLGLEAGDAHVIRNAGDVVTEDVLRSLLIFQRLLGTREIMLIHHTDCGMLTFGDAEVKQQIEREVGVRPPFALEAFADLEEDVRQSVARIRTSLRSPDRKATRGWLTATRPMARALGKALFQTPSARPSG